VRDVGYVWIGSQIRVRTRGQGERQGQDPGIDHEGGLKSRSGSYEVRSGPFARVRIECSAGRPCPPLSSPTWSRILHFAETCQTQDS